MKIPAARRTLFVIFTLSGFAGLIYESIWAQYLKLMLGHSAYAQTVVLVLFMGGMAIGAGLCGRVSARIRSPLLAYAVVELVLALLAFSFDPIFRGALAWLLEVAAPALGQPLQIEVLKWVLAAGLILPACILLGATFPLISAGVVRLAPHEAGNALGWLYFTNSLGAVIGVLTSGFLLIDHFGLPGTLATAGTCNLLLAGAVFFLAKRLHGAPGVRAAVPASEVTAAQAAELPISVHWLLAIAFLTGASSFMYEIGWIRMLSLVLGSATHSFELMLGAFILGIALGALWIRNRIDRIADPLALLAWVQIAMGSAAMLSIGVYRHSFGWMGSIVQTLGKTEAGYVWFTWLSQAICWAMMLPVTFFAGMTLPLITAILLRSSRAGEAAIGRVYAANTWGAILGVLLAVNLLMPLTGLRNLIIAGAIIDIALGFHLLRRSPTPLPAPAGAAISFSLLIVPAVALFWPLDPQRMASGVFRHGHPVTDSDVLWSQHGRAATVHVLRHYKPDLITITTNGKADASLSHTLLSSDDQVQILIGVLPLALKPEATTAAMIGLGSGRSSHTLLGSPGLERLDTVEIEPAIFEGARHFGELVSRVYEDPRSQIHIDDAKTFFARNRASYDLIVSEPSNPWVSGVAGLFTTEFYRQIQSHLNPGGLFVQWLQLYEFDDSLVASVLAALGEEFADYSVYMADGGNLLIVASQGQTPRTVDARVLQWEGMQALAESIGLKSTEDLRLRLLTTRDQVAAYVEALGVPPNSNYRPYLDQHAARHRFMGTRAGTLLDAHPVLHRLLDQAPIRYASVTLNEDVPFARRAAEAHQLVEYLVATAEGRATGASPSHARVTELASRLLLVLESCTPAYVDQVLPAALDELGREYWPYTEPEAAQELLAMLRRHSCQSQAERTYIENWLALLEAVSAQDWPQVTARGVPLAESARAADTDRKKRDRFPEPGQVPVFLAREVLFAAYRQTGAEGIRNVRQVLGETPPADASVKFLLTLAGNPEPTTTSSN